ncbi:hypothetical protein V8E53_002151 [Lactarius tabidus]
MSMYDQPTSYRNRRPSFSSGPAFGTAHSQGGFAPHNDFRRDGFSDRGQFGDPYASGFSESFPQSNGFSGSSYPPPGIMNTSYSVGTREQHPSPPFEPSGFEPTGGPPRAAAAYPDSYDNSPLSDNYFPPPMDDGPTFSARGRTLSTGGGGFGPPALLPAAQSMTPYSSHSHQQHYSKRGRRASSVGPGMGLASYAPDPYRRPGGVNVKFRLKGGYRQGITLSEATESARLSRSVSYSMHDLAPDARGRITLKVRWAGFRSLTYEIPVSTEYDGYVNQQSLARRVARAIVHFMTSNAIALSWDRVVLHRLEEITPGIWIPVLTTH